MLRYEAHATGFIEHNGIGTPDLFGVANEIDIINGTFGKDILIFHFYLLFFYRLEEPVENIQQAVKKLLSFKVEIKVLIEAEYTKKQLIISKINESCRI